MNKKPSDKQVINIRGGLVYCMYFFFLSRIHYLQKIIKERTPITTYLKVMVSIK
jgi:hypothetical protein